MKEPVYLTPKRVKAIQFTGSNEAELIEFYNNTKSKEDVACIHSILSNLKIGHWIYESEFEGDIFCKFISKERAALMFDFKYDKQFMFASEDPREKEESPACSPHTGFKVVDTKNKSVTLITDKNEILRMLSNCAEPQIAPYPDAKELMSMFCLRCLGLSD